MIKMYNEVCHHYSEMITKRYSTSFSMGIRAFKKRFRLPIYSIYGFVRVADEIVDTFHDFDKSGLLENFRNDTYKAIEEGISLNPVLHSFQAVVRKYHIERELIDAFLDSMAMDLSRDQHNGASYNTYIYGSAEVVGLMCLRVFCEGDAVKFEQLRGSARRLGAAFQKVNFLRDLKSDFDDRGRVYFPAVNFDNFREEDKKSIEQDIQDDFEAALPGIRALPAGTRLGVHLAYVYYWHLFGNIKNATAHKIKSQRIRVPDAKKMYLLCTTALKHKLNLL